MRATIELRLHDVEQIFDSLDAYPFYERDLDPDAEEYIVGSLRELPDRKACSIVVHLEGAGEAGDEQRVVESAIHGHFARRATLTSRELRMVVRRGTISLVIGLAFLSTLLFTSQIVADRLGEGAFASVLREGSSSAAGWRCGGRSRYSSTTGGRSSANGGSTRCSAACRYNWCTCRHGRWARRRLLRLGSLLAYHVDVTRDTAIDLGRCLWGHFLRQKKPNSVAPRTSSSWMTIRPCAK